MTQLLRASFIRHTKTLPPEVKAADDIDVYFGNRHKLVYDGNGVEAEMPEGVEYYSYQKFSISDKVPTAEGYIFLGWSRNRDGSGHIFEPEEDIAMKEGDILFYAQWKAVEPEIPPTGDSSDVLPWAIIAVLSISCLIFSFLYRRKTAEKPNSP